MQQLKTVPVLLLLLLGACTAVRDGASAPRPPAPARPPQTEALAHEPLDPASVRVQPEGITVEESWLLDIYTWLHSREYRAFRLVFESAAGGEAIAHLLVPEGRGPFPVVVVYPILAGDYVVSEGLAKALVNRGFAAVRLDRGELDVWKVDGPARVADYLHFALLDGRRLIDFLESHPKLDPQRIAAAGVSLGGILACTLHAADPRVRAGFYHMTGGGLAEIIYDSSEGPVRAFRDRLIEREALADREAFVRYLTPYFEALEPLRWAHRINPDRVLLVSARFDRVIRPEHTRALWEALGRPRWLRVPSGHYQFFPYFWWATGRGADKLEEVLGPARPKER